MTAPADGCVYLHPDELRLGLFVRLESGWTSHPFPFNSFLIRDAAQLAQLRQLGLAEVRCDTARSDSDALLHALSRPERAQTADEPEAAGAVQAALSAKQQRLARAEQQRERLEACERFGLATAREIALVQQNVFASPKETVQRALQLVDGVIARLDELADAQLLLMSARRGGGGDASEHELNCLALCLLLGRRLGLAAVEQRQLGVAALFHDIGLHELPSGLARKIGPLSAAERELLRSHVQHGVTVARGLRMPMDALLAIAQHHERADGSGYPQGLRLADIGRPGRVLGLVNAFDNLCNPPHALQGITPHEAVRRLFAKEARGFDTELLNTFITVVGIYPPGTLVRLNQGGVGLVLSANPRAALRPLVYALEGEGERAERIVLDLAQENDLTIAGALAPESLPAELTALLNPRRRAVYFPG